VRPVASKLVQEGPITARVELARQPCPDPGGAAFLEVLDALLPASVHDDAAQVVEHLQHDADFATEATDRVDERRIGARGDRAEPARERDELPRLALRDRADDRCSVEPRHVPDADRQVQRLTLVAAEKTLRDPLVRAQANVFGERHAREQHLRPEVQPVAGVERDGGAVQLVHGRRATPLVGAVLDVVHDERAGMEGLDEQRKLGRALARDAARKTEPEIDHARAELLARPPQEFTQRAEERLFAERRRDVGLRRGARPSIEQIRQRRGREVAHCILGRHVSATGANAPRREKPRGGSPAMIRARSRHVVEHARKRWITSAGSA